MSLPSYGIDRLSRWFVPHHPPSHYSLQEGMAMRAVIGFHRCYGTLGTMNAPVAAKGSHPALAPSRTAMDAARALLDRGVRDRAHAYGRSPALGAGWERYLLPRHAPPAGRALA